jgi:predicted membrane protein
MWRIIVGVFIILIGISALTGVSFFNFFFALVLIAIGIRIIVGRKHWYPRWEEKSVSHEDEINEVAIFSPLEKEVVSEHFKGGKVVFAFAGGEIDLRRAKAAGKTVDLDIAAVFGGARIIIPKEWTVNASKNAAIFGGVSNETEKGSGEVILNLKGAAIFGGLEITN